MDICSVDISTNTTFSVLYPYIYGTLITTITTIIIITMIIIRLKTKTKIWFLIKILASPAPFSKTEPVFPLLGDKWGLCGVFRLCRRTRILSFVRSSAVAAL